MLVDQERARPLTMPHGNAVPLGALYGLDIGTQWFHDVLNSGARIGHFDIAAYATHAWASATGGGHAALADQVIYHTEEARAATWLKQNHPDFPLTN